MRCPYEMSLCVVYINRQEFRAMAPTDEKAISEAYARWFRGTFTAIGSVEVFFALLTMLQGPSQVMSQFGIPEAVVASPHYLDAMFWVVLHMCFIGLISVSIGQMVTGRRAQKWFPRIFVLFHATYAYLDIRASDSVLGTGLYQGPVSLVTPVISCTLLLAMLHLAVRSFAER